MAIKPLRPPCWVFPNKRVNKFVASETGNAR
jgi:hypothetical protein